MVQYLNNNALKVIHLSILYKTMFTIAYNYPTHNGQFILKKRISLNNFSKKELFILFYPRISNIMLM